MDQNAEHMNNAQHTVYQLIVAVALAVTLAACSPSEGDHAGVEYMPDMYHSIAYESNYYDYYYYNTWGSEQNYYRLASPRKPVAGTVPRGYAGQTAQAGAGAIQAMKGANTLNAISVPVNGSVPYAYGNTEDERARATAELRANPYPITDDGLATGKELYVVFCGICHGDKGNGIGYLVNEESNTNVKYPAQPANFLSDEFVAASNGRYYHAIMHGKNVMGGYADKLSYEERWQVIHYIRSLQAKDRKLAYSEQENTLNDVEVPGASVASLKVDLSDPEHVNWGPSSHQQHDEHHGNSHDEESHGDADHGHDDDPHHGDNGH